MPMSCGMQSTIYMELAPGVSVVDLHRHLRIFYEREVVYGLPQNYRIEIKDACLVANPSYYPSSIQLPIVPLIKANLIKSKDIIFDSKSGVSGAGCGAKEANLYTKIAEGIHSYGITGHRRLIWFLFVISVPGIQQGLSKAANSEVTVSFIPHLMPMRRGTQSNIYVELAPGISFGNLHRHLGIFYEHEEFLVLLKEKEVPQHVRGSNYCVMNIDQ